MKTYLSTTKRGKALLEIASFNEGQHLWDVYGRYSEDKRKAWEECFAKCKEEGGSNFHICTHSGWKFTVAWNVEGGVRIKTATNSYLVELVD